MQISFKVSTLRKIAIYTVVAIVLAIIGLVVITNMNPNTQTQTIKLGLAEIRVQDLDNVQKFYKDLVGLDLLKSDETSATLGRGSNEIVRLVQQEGLQKDAVSQAGLYHIAVVFSDRTSLANAIRTILANAPQYYQGSSDHVATEAFYFGDPEGNGVELYFDKPRDQWKYDANGKPLMGSTYLDERWYIQTYSSAASIAGITQMGHMHLRIGNVADAKSFYVDLLGFDIINQSAQTLFVSYDNYHHHIGMNTWHSAGAGNRPENMYGLAKFYIQFLDSGKFEQVKQRLKAARISVVENGTDEFSVRDPWGNVVVITQ